MTPDNVLIMYLICTLIVLDNKKSISNIKDKSRLNEKKIIFISTDSSLDPHKWHFPVNLNRGHAN